MQRRLTFALIATALVSILLVGAGILAIAQAGARSRAEGDVTRSLAVTSRFLDRSQRPTTELQTQLSNSRSNLRLSDLAPVVIDDDGRIGPIGGDRRRGGPISSPSPRPA